MLMFTPKLLAYLNSSHKILTGKELQIKEYDGATVHVKLRRIAGMNKISDSEFNKLHLEMIFYALSNGRLGNIEKRYIEKLKSGVKGKNFHVFHDTGLDPQIDDYIAIKILEIIVNQE